jgi:hypothetical protein
MYSDGVTFAFRKDLDSRILLSDQAHGNVIGFDVLPGLHPLNHLLLCLSFCFDGFHIRKSVLFDTILQQPLID